MTTLRSLADVFALSILLVTLTSHDAAAQGKGKPPPGGSFAEAIECPSCGKVLPTTEGVPPSVCPSCGAKFDVSKNPDGSYSVRIIEISENKWKKPLIYGGGILFVVGIIGVVLKYTVFAPAPPKRKKKNRRDDDDDDDDRPRKKNRPAAEDDDEDRPKKAKKPRIVEEDED